MSVQSLDLLKLAKVSNMAQIRTEPVIYLVSIPIFEHFILAYRPKVVCIALESHLHYAVLVCKQRFVTVPKVETPYLDVLVGGASYDKLGVGRYVHTKYRQLYQRGFSYGFMN